MKSNTEKFHKFVNKLRTEENSTLVESIESGFNVIFEGLSGSYRKITELPVEVQKKIEEIAIWLRVKINAYSPASEPNSEGIMYLNISGATLDSKAIEKIAEYDRHFQIMHDGGLFLVIKIV